MSKHKTTEIDGSSGISIGSEVDVWDEKYSQVIRITVKSKDKNNLFHGTIKTSSCELCEGQEYSFKKENINN